MRGASRDRVSVRAQAWELRAWAHSAFLPGDTHPCISLLPSARWPHLWIPAHKSTFHQEEGAAARPLRAGCSVLGSQICANAPSPNKPRQPSHSLGGPLLLALLCLLSQVMKLSLLFSHLMHAPWAPDENGSLKSCSGSLTPAPALPCGSSW